MNDDLDPTTVAEASSEAAEKATGKPWSEWMALLDEAGGRQKNHKQIVDHLRQHYDVSKWWMQGITVTYEKSRRLRQTHEMADGYQISRTRTMAAPAEAIYRAWTDDATRRRWLPDAEFTVRTTTPPKTIRVNWSDETSVEVRLSEKESGKTTVAVQHNKLPDGDAAERMKAYWAAALDRLRSVVEG